MKIRVLLASFGIWTVPEKVWKECAACYALGSWDLEACEYLMGVPRHLFPQKFWDYSDEYYAEYERQMNLAEQSFQM